jgi:glucose/arabinose dehydrogenase
MPITIAAYRGMLVAVGAGALLWTAPPVQAQEDPKGPPAVENPAPPEGPLMGRPETPGAHALAPIAAPPLATPEDKLPTDKLKLPDGFKLEVFASGITNARTVRTGDNGTVFVGNWRGNKVWAVTEKDGKREAKVIYEDLDWPNGIAFHDGTLYIAEHKKISKAENIGANLDNPPALVSIYEDLGDPRPHGWRFLGVGPDEKLYVSNSSPCNICMPEAGFGEIRKLNLDGSGAEPILRGMRNTVGFDWHPDNGQLYFTDNNRDWLSEDLPHGELNRVTEPGKQHFGFPYCHQGDLADPEFGWGYKCEDFTPPIGKLGPHPAPLGMRFYTGEMFPEKYRGAIFIARHGSWNRTVKLGGDIVVAYLNEDGTFDSMEPFLTGFIEDNNYVGRPVDVEVMPDGSLLVSDDWNGAVYRVSYGG